MDLYNLRDWNAGNDVWFDAGSGAAGWNRVRYIYVSLTTLSARQYVNKSDIIVLIIESIVHQDTPLNAMMCH